MPRTTQMEASGRTRGSSPYDRHFHDPVLLRAVIIEALRGVWHVGERGSKTAHRVDTPDPEGHHGDPRRLVEAGLIDGSGGTRPPRAYHRTQADASHYQRWGVVYMAAIYIGLLAALLELVPLFAVVPLIMVAYVRGALLTHELMHVRRPEQVTWMLRMMMLFDTPLCLGYREHQNIHLRHHRQPATAGDPEYFQIRGGRVRAFFAALVGPELTTFHWLRTQGLSRSLAREASIRAAIMLALLILNPSVFVGYWIALRLTVGVSNYMFHHVLHYRAGEYGTYQLRMAWPLDAGLRLAVGSSLAAVLTEHDAHHAWCTVRAENLRGLLRRFPPRLSTESSL